MNGLVIGLIVVGISFTIWNFWRLKNLRIRTGEI
jgi:hypothetical protein